MSCTPPSSSDTSSAAATAGLASISAMYELPAFVGKSKPQFGRDFEKHIVGLFRPNEADEVDMRSAVQRAAADFLTADVVTSRVTEAEVADRFQHTAMPQDPCPPLDYLQLLKAQGVVDDSVHTSNPLMIGHMTSSLPFFTRPLAELLVAMNQNVVKTETAKTLTFLERESLAQLHREIFHCDEEFYRQHVQNVDVVLGVFTSGGTVANITALWIARNSNLGPTRDFRGVEHEGLHRALNHYGYADAVIIGSELMHYSMNKAADLLGLGLSGLIKIPVDDYYQANLERMEEVIRDCLEKRILIVAMVGVCGATETGAIDPLDRMAELAEKYDIHFHVDAAWGGPNIFSRTQRTLVAGIERADTVTLDGHKQLYLPMGAGMCFMKDPKACHSIRKTANYIIRKESYDLGKFTLEGSRPGAALFLHANMNIVGLKGYECLIDRSVRVARHMATQVLKSRNFELLVKPMSNILLYRYVPASLRDLLWEGQLSAEHNEVINEINIRLQEKQKFLGRTFVSRTTIRCPKYDTKIVALRVVIGNPLTTEKDIDKVLEDQLAIVPSLTSDCDVSPSLVSMAGNDAEGGTEEGFWSKYWDALPEKHKLVFKHDKAAFFRSLAHWQCDMSVGKNPNLASLVADNDA